ncbi:unnamed protein product [Colletotrichum noveboracense]|uniref:F-box domain-containing protein n=1 Tax=Colletotrichum noveboracense TaxID=2664923 RepID=A0A9W4RIU0_9PEZI|nr:unnamed protein product [Colletotrichum noveboracense]
MYRTRGNAPQGGGILGALKATEMLDSRPSLPAGWFESFGWNWRNWRNCVLTCPPEILVAILDYLPVADLMQVARASRRMQEMVYDDTRWVARLKSMGCWNEAEARQRFDEAMRKRREAAERAAKGAAGSQPGAPGSHPPKPTSTMLFDATVEEERRKRQSAAPPVDGFERLTVGAPAAKDPFKDPEALLDVIKNSRSIRGHAREEYGKIYGSFAPFYFDLARAKSHTDPIVFQVFRDPERQAKMLSNLQVFAKSDWAQGWNQREERLMTMTSIFEGAVLREFEQGYEFWDVDGRMKRYAHVLHTLNGGNAATELFIQKHPIFSDREVLAVNSSDCVNQTSGDEINLEPSRLFFEMLLRKVNEHAEIIGRIFANPDVVFWEFMEKVREDVIMDYITPLFDATHDRNLQWYLKAVAGTFEQGMLFFKSVVPPKDSKSNLEEKAKEMMLRVFEPHLDLYLQEELDFFTRHAESEVAEWEKKLSEQDASVESFYMSNFNRQADKKDFLSSFRKVVMMPVTVLPSFGSTSTTTKPTTPNGTSALSPQPSRPHTPSLAPNTDGNGRLSPLPAQAPTDELAAKAALMASRMEGIKTLFSIEIALNLTHKAKTSMGRASLFIQLGGQYGEEAREQCETIFVVMLRILGNRHVKVGFEKAVEHLSHYNPREVSDHNQSGVAPLVTFIELVNVGDLISQMIDVFYEQQLAGPKIADRNDFLDPAGIAKKKWEQMLDESVAAGLNKGIDVLMDEVEYLHGTTQQPTDYNPSETGGILADPGPTETALRIKELVSSHTRMLVGTTEKSMLDVFNGEVGLRLFTAVCKHLKRQRISTEGAIKLIADMNLYFEYIRTLKNQDLLAYFKALRELSQIYLIDAKHAKEMATIIADGDRFEGVFRAEEAPVRLALSWSKVQLARNLSTPVLLDQTRPLLEICTHLLLAAALLGQIRITRGLGLSAPPVVLQHVLGRDALLRIENERLHEQVHARGSHGAESTLVVVPAPDRLAVVGDGVSRQLGDAWPVVFCGGSDGTTNERDLLNLRLGRHVRRTDDELRKHAAYAPDIDSAAVVLAAEEQLRRAVPACDDLVGHDLVRIREASRETEISKLDLAVGSDQQVVGLDIAMQHEVLVAEPDGAGEHTHPGLDICGTVADVGSVFDEHLEVAKREVFEDEVEVLVFGGEDGEEGDDVRMLEFLEVLQFAHGVGGHAFLVFFLDFDLLDGDEGGLVGTEVAEEDDGVGTFT